MTQPAAQQWQNRATFFAPSLILFDSEPANDATKTKEVAEFKWIHCANEGMYKGHHQGEFDLTRATFDAFIRNLHDDPQYGAGSLDLGGKTYTGGIKPVIQFDYEHASEMPPWEGSIAQHGAPACGWVLDVAMRDGPDGKAQLWAFGQLGSQIRGQILRNEYRSVSIAFTLEGVHWITGAPIGPCLTSIAFTNHPYMRDLEPLAAANRRTSAPAGSRVKPSGESSEAPGGSRNSQPMGAQMADTTLLRERVCKALKIQTLADDAAVGDAVEEAAVGAGNLKSLLEALGVAKPEEAMKVLPELRSAREKLAGLLSELDALLAQEQAQDAEVAKVDIGAAMKAQNFTGAGAERALAAYRSQCVGEELRKVEASKKDGETIKLSELREALKKGRERFLTEYNVKANEHASLATPLVAGRGGAQLAPPTASRVLPPTERDGEMPVLDLRGCAGRNPTEKLISHLKKAEPGFDKLALETQIQRASAMRKTHELTL